MRTTRRRSRLLLLMIGCTVSAGVSTYLATHDISGDYSFPLQSSSQVETDLSERADVVGVIDGDTLVVTRTGDTEEVRVRLIGINTPELGRGEARDECFADEARERLEQLITPGSTITLTSDATKGDSDKYGRLLRHATAPSGDNVVLSLLAGGAGPEYTYDTAYVGQAEYRAAEQQARFAAAGYWGACQ